MTVRTVPPTLAPVLELLELEQPRVVTTAQIGDLAQQAGVGWPVDVVVRRLRERGWLLPLATKGVWEFAPAARAGAIGSGDPLIELRAVLARDPDAPYAVAAESAAYMLGLSARRPEPECASAPPDARSPKSLSAMRLVRWKPSTPLLGREGLPVWAPVTLIAFMATRPAAYHDWPNAGDWLPRAVDDVGVDALARELEGRSTGSWARAGYLLHRAGAGERAAGLMTCAPRGKGPHYLGDRSVKGRYDREFDVVDSTGLEVASA